MDDKTAYKEALERARNYFESPRTCFDIDALTDIFPELKESDEKIRGAIIDHLKDNNLTEWAAWLEKQAEQKSIMNVPSREVILSIWDLGNEWKELTNGCISTEHGTQLDYIQKHWHESEYYLRENLRENQDKPELKFNVGDWVVNKLGVAWHIDSFDKKNYQVTGRKGNHNYFPIAKQDEMRHWSITDAKSGDVLAFSYASRPYILIYKGLYEKKFETLMSVFCFYNVEEDTYYDETDNFHVMNTGEIITPASKEQRDLLFQKMQEAGYIFDFEKRELQKIHVIDEKASPTYNEEDEEYNGEDYGIDSLYHALRILEKTLGEVDGYQSDDGILEHKCAISAVKKLYEQKPAEWTEEDESMYTRTLGILGKCYMGQLPTKVEDELKWLKSLNTQKNLKQICNTVDLSKNENEVLKLLYNELREKFKGESVKVFI